MFKKVTAASLGLAIAMPVTAMAAMETMDADGDGMVTMSEFTDAMPAMGAEVFAEIDTNADGALDEDELQAAMEAGILPAE